MLQWLVDAMGEHSLWAAYGFVFGVLLLCGFGIPMPEDIVLVTGGVLAWLGSPAETVTFKTMWKDPILWSMIAVGFAGILAGDSVIYWAGRLYGHRIAEHRFLRRIVTPEKLEAVRAVMRRRGNIAVLIARYLPGLRAPTYFTAGHAHFPYWEFLLFDGAAAVISAPLWVCLGYYFGDNIEQAAHTAKQFSRYILIGAVIAAAAIAFWAWNRRRKRKAAAPPPGPGRGADVIELHPGERPAAKAETKGTPPDSPPTSHEKPHESS
jgi:membrane protein DedA with SNARE-associated domain